MKIRSSLLLASVTTLSACAAGADPSASAPAAAPAPAAAFADAVNPAVGAADRAQAASVAPAAAAAPNCPTAPENLSLNLFFWRTRRTLDGFIWSADGAQILGIETLVEEKQTITLFGLQTITRKPCHQLYWTTLDGAPRQNLGGPSELEIVNAYAFPKSGYVAIEKHSGTSNWQFERVALDGTRKPYAAIDGSCDWARVVPSPDGTVVAYAHSVATSCAPGSLAPSTTTVGFFDAAGTPIGGKGAVTLSGFAAATWTPAGQLVVSDGSSASSVALDGTVAAAPVPGCTDPPTTSSNVDASGRLLDIHDGKPAVVAVDDSRRFGCQ